jgi:hypothetical protein
MSENGRIPYVCGPLTELPAEIQESVKRFYSRIGDVCLAETKKRAFVPHEHYDPVKHPYFSPIDVDKAERNQVREKTSILIVVAIAPSWGGGIEVEIANESDVPVLILCEMGKKISRLLLGNPAVGGIIWYRTQEDALIKLGDYLSREYRAQLMPDP